MKKYLEFSKRILILAAAALFPKCGLGCHDYCEGNVLHTCRVEAQETVSDITDCGEEKVCKEWKENGNRHVDCVVRDEECPDGVYSYCNGNVYLECKGFKYPTYRKECLRYCVFSQDYGHAGCTVVNETCSVEGKGRCVTVLDDDKIEREYLCGCYNGIWDLTERCHSDQKCEVVKEGNSEKVMCVEIDPVDAGLPRGTDG